MRRRFVDRAHHVSRVRILGRVFNVSLSSSMFEEQSMTVNKSKGKRENVGQEGRLSTETDD